MYLAEHKKLNVYRAVKCIDRTRLISDQLFLEADILKNLKHPGIPTIYDIEEDEQYIYIIEEYIQGQSLEAFMLRQDCISAETVIHIMLQVCDVLQYLHEQPVPIIYQDLKPEHILLCGKRIILIDFGIAAYITKIGNTFNHYGTEGYAPPEIYQGHSCDTRSDVYGIGRVLECLAAKVPPDEVPILQPIMQRALAYAAEERYPSVQAMKQALREGLQEGCQNTQPRQNEKKHLLTTIAVAGTQERVGTTHIAIALSCFFNQEKRPCIYQEYHVSDSMRSLVREAGGRMREDGMIVYGDFKGMPYYGEGIARWDMQAELCIQDYGIHYQDLLEEETPMILVTGSRPWEMDATRKLLNQISLREHLVIICNYGDGIQAKSVARAYQHRIYCFPLDADPFRMTREKRSFFRKLQGQEGW